MKEGTLFYTTVPRRPFEIERTAGTEVIVRHGRERRVGSVGLVRVKTAVHVVSFDPEAFHSHSTHSTSWLCSPRYNSSPLCHHSPVSSPSQLSCSLYFISTYNGKVMPHTRCHTSLSYLAQVCSIHGHSSPPSLSRQPYMRSVATHALSRTTQVTPHF